MRKRYRTFFLPILISLFIFSIFSAGIRAHPVKADNELYTQKIVAVVYDNSGSMFEEARSPNAKYALQALMSIFDSDDVMSIFPLNPSQSKNGISVDLSNPDRGKVIEEVIKVNPSLTPTWGDGTPPDAVGYAVDWLVKNDMSTLEQIPGKEYWLVILSDGEFTGNKGTSTIIRDEISGCVGLQTIYFGISAGAGMNIDDLVQENSAVKAYYTKGTDDIITAMRELSNQVSGRYTLPSGVSINGNKVTIDLSECSFSISSVALLAEGSDPAKNISLEKVECSTVALKNIRASSISVHESFNRAPYVWSVDKSGYSSVVVPESANEYLNKDIITLTFNTEIDSLSVLVEPAIKLDSWLEYYDNDSKDWIKTDIDSINTEKEFNGRKIRPRFKLLDGKTGENLTDTFDNISSSVSYGGRSYENYDNGIGLLLDKNELSLSVTVKIGDSKYILYNSWLCDIDANPENFNIKEKVTQDNDTIKVDYVVNDEGKQVSKSEFTSGKYTWEIIELNDPQGRGVNPITKEVQDDGTITIEYKINKNLFGVYKNKIKVVRQDNKRYRFGESEFILEVKQLSLSTTQSGGMTLTTNQLTRNMTPIDYNLTASGQPLAYSESMLGYSFKINGVDLTNKVEFAGNILSFIPNKDNLPSSLIGVGEKTIELKVWSKADPSISATTSSKLTIIDSTYVIDVIEENNKVDIYNLSNCKAKIKYRVSLDGEYLTAEELQAGLDSGQIKLSYNRFGWDLLLPPEVTTQVVEVGGSAYIECSLGTTWWKPIASLTGSFIFTGEKAVTLEVGGLSGVGTFALSPVNILSRIWRWVVILLILYTILHIVLWIIGFFTTRPLPRGFLVKVDLPKDQGKDISVEAFTVNYELGPKIAWHMKRFIPFKEFINQPTRLVDEVNFLMDVNKKEAREIGIEEVIRGEEMIRIDKETCLYTDGGTFLSQFKNDCQGYRGKKDIYPQFEGKVKAKQYRATLVDKLMPTIEAGIPTLLDEDSCYVYKEKKGKKLIIKEVRFFIRTF